MPLAVIKEIPPTAVVVRAVEATAREARLEPSEQRLVAYMHPERDLRVAPVSAEGPLADQQACHDAALEVRQGHGLIVSPS